MKKISEQFIANTWRKLDSGEIAYLNNFIKIMKNFYDLCYSKSTTLNDWNKLSLFIFQNVKLYPFLENVQKLITSLKREKSNVKQADQLNSLVNTIRDERLKIEKFLLSLNTANNFNSILQSANKIESLAKKFKLGSKSFESIDDYYIQRLKNLFSKSVSSLFFSGGKSSSFIDDFDKPEWENLISTIVKDGQKTKLSKLKKSKDFTYYVWYLNNITIKSQEELNIEKLIKFYYEGSKDFKNLMNDVDKFQFHNNKSLFQSIISQLSNFPEIVEYHNKLKQKTKIVYRGIPIKDDEDEDSINKKLKKSEVMQQEKSKLFVSTSKYIDVALNFAYSKGHLEHIKRTNGYIIEYLVDADSILLDFDLFGSAFGEDEIIIDPRKAKIKSIKIYR